MYLLTKSSHITSSHTPLHLLLLSHSQIFPPTSLPNPLPTLTSFSPSLDVLLGLGADESMIEEEPIGSAININNVNHSSNNINDSNSSNNNNHNNKIENITTVTTTSSSTNQDNSRTAKENNQPSHNDKRTTARQPRRRVQLGSSDIFSDDDDDDGPSHSISSSTVNVSGYANNQAITSAAAVVGKRGRTVNEDKVLIT